ncbi:MAG: DUF3618 domain-containing protein [Nocardioidaceae bacterium]
MTTTHEGIEHGSPRPEDQDGASPDVDQLQADIERTREDLGATVEALSAKLDVKGRAKQKVSSTRDQAADRAVAVKANVARSAARAKDSATGTDGRPTTPVLVGIGVAAAVLAASLVLVWRRRR